jgi:Undecaprenyl-phosphate galactose phosphotransferase WbaP
VGFGAGAPRLLVLLLSDAASLFLAGAVAYIAWARPVHGQDPSLYLGLTPAILLFLLGYSQFGLYPGFGLGPVETLRRYWLMTCGVFLALAAASFALKIPHQYSRMTTGIAIVTALALVPVFRSLTLRLARRWSWWAEPVVIVGAAAGIRRATEILSRRPGLGFRPVGVIELPTMAPGAMQVVPTLTNLAESIPRGVRIALVDLREVKAHTAIDRLRQFFPRVVILRDFDELPVEGVQVRNLGGVLGVEYNNNLLRRGSRIAKRTTDIILGGAGLVLAAPVIVVSAVAIKVLSRGPAFFWQDREGHLGKSIRVPKIRTMLPGADERLNEHLQQDAALQAEWNNGFKLRRDPRIIPVVGRMFRRFSIDELPQLWSVVRGDMSLVGPRPFPHYHLDALSATSRRLRSEVRPGITGLWQVAARGVADIEEQEGYDVYYIRNWSFWLDLYILGKTGWAVISGKGAY